VDVAGVPLGERDDGFFLVEQEIEIARRSARSLTRLECMERDHLGAYERPRQAVEQIGEVKGRRP
jgi:hypothetical protein